LLATLMKAIPVRQNCETPKKQLTAVLRKRTGSLIRGQMERRLGFSNGKKG